jgi:hypothetical protein
LAELTNLTATGTGCVRTFTVGFPGPLEKHVRAMVNNFGGI